MSSGWKIPSAVAWASDAGSISSSCPASRHRLGEVAGRLRVCCAHPEQRLSVLTCHPAGRERVADFGELPRLGIIGLEDPHVRGLVGCLIREGVGHVTAIGRPGQPLQERRPHRGAAQDDGVADRHGGVGRRRCLGVGCRRRLGDAGGTDLVHAAQTDLGDVGEPLSIGRELGGDGRATGGVVDLGCRWRRLPDRSRLRYREGRVLERSGECEEDVRLGCHGHGVGRLARCCRRGRCRLSWRCGRRRRGNRRQGRGDDRRSCRRGRLRRQAEGRRGGCLADLRLLRRAIEQHDRQERAEHGREASAGTGEDHRRASPKGHPGEPAALDPGPNPRAEVAGWRDVTQAAHDPPLFGECGERGAALAAGVEMGIEPLTLGVRQLLGE